MTISELIATLAANITVTVQESDASVLLKFVSGAGAVSCFAATFLAREVDTIQLTGNAAITVKLKASV